VRARGEEEGRETAAAFSLFLFLQFGAQAAELDVKQPAALLGQTEIPPRNRPAQLGALHEVDDQQSGIRGLDLRS